MKPCCQNALHQKAARALRSGTGMYGSRSGFQGDMFPPQKPGAAIDLVAAQVHDDFRPILEGEEDVVGLQIVRRRK